MRVLYSITALLSAGTMLAQQAPMFPTPAYFRRQFSTPQTRVELQPPVRLKDFVVGGKVQLSLRNYIELVMANNTDVALQRLNLETPKNNVMAAFGRFDPTLNLTFDSQRQISEATSELEGASQPKSLTHGGTLGYSQTFMTGTRLDASFGDTRTSNNSTKSLVNPSHNGSFQVGFTQPLLRGRGIGITKLQITIARSNQRRSEYDFRDQLMGSIQQAEAAYWSVVGARENLKVSESSLELKQKSLERANRELELGASSPLDIYQPKADVAIAEIQVSNRKFTLAQREDELRKWIGADLDPDIRKLPIELTEGLLPPADAIAIDPEAEVQKALSLRPDLKSDMQQLDIDDLNIRNTQNSLRPQLDLTGSYRSNGTANQIVNGNLAPGGFTDFVGRVFEFNNPTYRMGFTLRFPLRDRANEANLANNLIAKKRSTLNVRNAQQNARLAVLNAINSLESAKKGVELAQVSVDIAQKQLDAEQQKYDLGTQIIYFVQQAQDRLNSAKSELVRSTIAYQNAKTTLLQQTGELLDERGIVIK